MASRGEKHALQATRAHGPSVAAGDSRGELRASRANPRLPFSEDRDAFGKQGACVGARGQRATTFACLLYTSPSPRDGLLS
eukprot:3488367-Pleurochrysis_carterae.AAC.1